MTMKVYVVCVKENMDTKTYTFSGENITDAYLRASNYLTTLSHSCYIKDIKETNQAPTKDTI